MTKIIEAVYSGGVLKPTERLDLPQQQRVRVAIESFDSRSDLERQRARDRLMERLQRSTPAYGGPLPTRDELHERDGGSA